MLGQLSSRHHHHLKKLFKGESLPTDGQCSDPIIVTPAAAPFLRPVGSYDVMIEESGPLGAHLNGKLQVTGFQRYAANYVHAP